MAALLVLLLPSQVNEDYLMHLSELDKKLLFINQDDIARQSQSKRDLERALEKLRVKAVSRVREFILQKVRREGSRVLCVGGCVRGERSV
jgi:hypothetical protein